MKRGTKVTISWVDSSSASGWQSDPQQDLRCESTGYFVSQTKDSITIALNRSFDPMSIEFGQFITIPKVAVTKIKRI